MQKICDAIAVNMALRLCVLSCYLLTALQIHATLCDADHPYVFKRHKTVYCYSNSAVVLLNIKVHYVLKGASPSLWGYFGQFSPDYFLK